MEASKAEGEGEVWTGGLPVDVWLEVAGWLDGRGLVSMLLVSRSTHALFSHPKFYKERLRFIWPSMFGDEEQSKRSRGFLLRLSQLRKGIKPSTSSHSSSSSSSTSSTSSTSSSTIEGGEGEDEEGGDGVWSFAFKWRQAVLQNWNKGNVRLVRTITTQGPVRGLDFDEEANLLVLANKKKQTGQIAVCNLDSGPDFHHVVAGATSWVNGVYLRYGRIFSCANDSAISVWELPVPKKLRTMSWHTSGIQCLHFLPVTKHQLLSCSWDRKLALWDIEAGKVIRSVDLEKHGVINSAYPYRVTCDETEQTIIATASSNAWAALDFSSMNPITMAKTGRSEVLALGVQFVPGSSTRFIRCAFNRTPVVSTTTSDDPTKNRGIVEEYDIFMGSKEPVSTFASSERLAGLHIEGDDMILGGEQHVIIRSLATGEVKRTLPIPKGKGKQELVWSLKLSGSGLLATGTRAVHLWDVSGQRPLMKDLHLPNVPKVSE